MRAASPPLSPQKRLEGDEAEDERVRRGAGRGRWRRGARALTVPGVQRVVLLVSVVHEFGRAFAGRAVRDQSSEHQGERAVRKKI